MLAPAARPSPGPAADRRGHAGQPGRDRAGLGPRHRWPLSAPSSGRTAAPRAAAPSWTRQGRHRPRTGLVLDPYFSAPKMAWLRRNVTGGGGHHLRQLAGAPADRRVRHRCLHGQPVAGGRPRHRDWDGAAGAVRAGRGAAADDPSCDEVVGTTSASAARARRRTGGRSAGRAARRGLPGPGEAKCTFGTGAFLLANTGTTAVRSTAGLTSSVAWRSGRDHLLPRRAGLHRGFGSPLDQQLGFITTAADLDTVAAADAGGCCAYPRWPGWPRPGGGRTPRPP